LFTGDAMNNKEPNENEALRPVLHRLLVTCEDEKRATALFLHDEIAQCLAMISLHLSVMNKQHMNGPQTIGEGLKKVQQVLRTAQEKVRDLEFRLYPKVVEYSITEAIKGHLQRLRSDHGYSIEFVSPAAIKCGKNTAIGLYRVVESLFASRNLRPSVAWQVTLSAAAEVTVSVIQASAPVDGQSFVMDRLTLEHVRAHGGRCTLSVDPLRIEAVFPLG
jgi:signal transduction histidine kinase